MHSGKAAKVVRYQIIMKNTAEQDKRMSRIYGHYFYFAHDESLKPFSVFLDQIYKK